METTTVVSAREAGDRLGLEHTEVIRRIRKGDIEARKLGWVWIINTREVEAVRTKDWYISVMARRQRA